MRYNLALSYYDLGNYEGAIEQYQQIVRKWPNDPKGHFLLCKAYIAGHQFSDAMRALRHAHAMSPKDIRDVLDLGDMLSERGARHEAVEAYHMALETQKKPATVHKKLGFVYKADGMLEKAVAEFEKALLINADDGEIKNALESLK